MKDNKIYLTPVDNHKSFYGKCYVTMANGVATLYSYNTKIMSYNTETKEVTKYSAYNYSMTTRRHQKAFETMYGIKTA